jgi:hypothetical protein
VIQVVLWFALGAGAIYAMNTAQISSVDRDQLAQPVFKEKGEDELAIRGR